MSVMAQQRRKLSCGPKPSHRPSRNYVYGKGDYKRWLDSAQAWQQGLFKMAVFLGHRTNRAMLVRAANQEHAEDRRLAEIAKGM